MTAFIIDASEEIDDDGADDKILTHWRRYVGINYAIFKRSSPWRGICLYYLMPLMLIKPAWLILRRAVGEAA